MMKKSIILILCVFLIPVAVSAKDVLFKGRPVASDRILLELKSSYNAVSIAQLEDRGWAPQYASFVTGEKLELRRLKSSSASPAASSIRFIAVGVPENMSVARALEKAGKLPFVKAAWPDGRVFAETFEPNDPYYTPYQSNFRQILLPEAWRWTFGEGVTVAVIDTGYNDGLDDGANIIDAYDFWDEDTDVADFIGHGTFVSNVIGEASNNNLGCASIAPAAKIMALKVFSDDPNQEGTSDSYIIQAVDYAVERGADIISMSLGGGAYNGALNSSLQDAYDAGVAIFAASGNEGRDSVEYPAAYSDVIAVGSSKPHAVGANPGRSDFSCYGEKLDLVAPGEYIVQQGKLGGEVGYYGLNGTSMACPHAAGLAALLIALASDKPTPAEIKEVMTENANSGYGGWDPTIGWGEIDAAAAITHYVNQLPNLPPTAGISASPTSGSAPLEVIFSAASSSDPDNNIDSYQWSLPDFSIEHGVNITHVFNEKGTFEVMMTVLDKFGESDSTSITITVSGGSSSDDSDKDDSQCALAHGGDPITASTVSLFAVVYILFKVFSFIGGKQRKNQP